MAKSEWREFELRLKIKDSDGQIKELRDKGPIKLEEDNNKLHAEQYILFKKDGKEYPVLVKIENMQRGFIKDGGYSSAFEIPKNAEFSYYYEEGVSNWDCKLVQHLRVGRVVALSLSVVILIGGIVAMVLWKKKHPSD